MMVFRLLLVGFVSVWTSLHGADATARPKQDANGNPVRYAPTGHVSNYDETKAGGYTLPDPLVLKSGERVRDAETWMKRRRPEVLEAYQREIYGRVPPTAPKVSYELVESGTSVLDGVATRTHVVMRFGSQPDGPKTNVVLYVPTKAKAPVPVLLQLVFFSGLPSSVPAPVPAPTASKAEAPVGAPATLPRPRISETNAAAEIIGRGYGYATIRYTEIEGDRADANLSGVRKLALGPNQEKPAADEWGTIAAWAWGASRVLDYFETNRAVDAKRVGLIGHSRLGKTVLWAGANDPRFALVFSSCSGEMGAALARRDFGESIDDMALNFPWQFAHNFQKYIGRWGA